MWGNIINKSKSSKNIKSITIGDNEHKLPQFADDTTLILDGSDESLIQTLSAFAFILLICLNKTKIFGLANLNMIKIPFLSFILSSIDRFGLNKMFSINYEERKCRKYHLIGNEEILLQWEEL